MKIKERAIERNIILPVRARKRENYCYNWESNQEMKQRTGTKKEAKDILSIKFTMSNREVYNDTTKLIMLLIAKTKFLYLYY